MEVIERTPNRLEIIDKEILILLKFMYQIYSYFFFTMGEGTKSSIWTIIDLLVMRA
jgi:hypothetical protein